MEVYQQDINALVQQLNSDVNNGLDESAIQPAIQKFGKNVLRPGNNRNTFQILTGQLTGPLSIILIVASLASFYLKQPRDGLILMIIIVMNALIGFYQEWKAENILASIKRLVVDKCLVIRQGKTLEIFSEDLVPGEIVLLSEGAGIPADIRLIESKGFSANEFILTGESLPARKDPSFTADKKIALSEIRNSVFMGTTVARGEARGIVYATGMSTEIGKISTSSQKIKSADVPIQVEIKDVAKKLTVATLIIGICLFATRLFMNDSTGVALVFAISVAAAMVPEGLPAQISMALALAVGRLAKRKAIVKKIASAQTLGSATVIASDKTGTITKNEMTITGCYFNGMIFSVSGLGFLPAGEILDERGRVLKKESFGDLKVFFLSGFLSSTGKINPPDKYHPGWYCIGDPTEAAFATLAMKAGFSLDEIEKDYPKVKVFGFDSFRKRATIVRRHKEKTISFVKGSLESVLMTSERIISNGNITELTPAQRQEILTMSAAFAGNALRIIAIAYRDLGNKDDYTIDEAERQLTFAGFVTMFDPPHEEVKYAIESVFKAHMKVFMITGDNEVTARAIAKNIGLMNENNEFPDVINGTSLQSMSDAEIIARFKRRAIIFSRVSPDDKFRIVELLKAKGEIVAVTGDGVNDTLSLKRADIGVAMGLSGSKVAQEAADIILLDDNFSTIVLAIKEGRTIFRNLEKTIKTNLSSNIAELTCVLAGFAGAFGGIPTPIFAVQILLIDMVGEMFPLIMLTYDPPEKEIMEIPPRDPRKKILTKETMLGILFNGTIIGIAAYGGFLTVFFQGQDLPNNYERALTVSFTSIILGQYANLLSRRTFGPAFGRYLVSNKNLLFAFALSLLLLFLIVYVPLFNLYFHTSPLLLTDWLLPLASGVLCLFIFEYRKKMKTASFRIVNS
ncbi:MAG TPA: cation-transporting P-type ATPase [Chitinophagaceae bacterium]